jgi:hypothetical protein
MLDGWMAFSAEERVVDLIVGLRQRLDSLLASKVTLSRATAGLPILNLNFYSRASLFVASH